MNREMILEGTKIDDDNDCYVIAEIGHNHQGSLEQCKELFLSAKQCGANAVKLQKRDNRSLFVRVDLKFSTTRSWFREMALSISTWSRT